MNQKTLFQQFDEQMLTRPSGEALRDTGMSRASEHANSQHIGWTERALNFVRTFPAREFMTEDVREFAYSNGLPHPPDDRAWGTVITTARRQGLIVHDRYAAVDNPKAHARPASVWRRVK